jgi:hypothetical protein
MACDFSASSATLRDYPHWISPANDDGDANGKSSPAEKRGLTENISHFFLHFFCFWGFVALQVIAIQ